MSNAYRTCIISGGASSTARHLQVTPMHKKHDYGTTYVALCLKLSRRDLVPDRTINAVFELSIYNHSNGTYHGCKASHDFHLKNNKSEKQCLIPLDKLLKSSDFLADDKCVFGVEILKLDIHSPEKKAILVQKKATSVQNLFIQKKGFIKGTYTWTLNNFLELDTKDNVCSPKFEVGGYKWHLRMYPHGVKYVTDCLSLFLDLEAADEVPPESGKVVKMTLSILDQKHGKHFTKTSGNDVFDGKDNWGWYNFLLLEKIKDPFRGYLVGSCCVVKADFTIIGSSNSVMVC